MARKRVRRIRPIPGTTIDPPSSLGPEWVGVPYRDGWAIAVKLEGQEGRPVVAGLHVFRHFYGDDRSEELPPGGLSFRRLQGFRLEDVLAVVRERVQSAERTDIDLAGPLFGGDPWDPSNPHGLAVLGIKPARLSEPRRTGPKGRPDRYYAEYALAYLQLIARGSSKPVADLAHERYFSTATVSDILNGARNRGLLTRPPPGRYGGKLTAKGRKVLGLEPEEPEEEEG